jgi:hypothetical protein
MEIGKALQIDMERTVTGMESKYDPDEFFGRKRKNHTGVIPPLNRCASSIFVEDTNVPSKKPTNADRIRGMSDEKLAAWLVNLCCSTCGDAANARLAMYHGGLFAWLQQEVDDGGTD